MTNVQYSSALALLTVLVAGLLALFREASRRGDDVRVRLDGFGIRLDSLIDTVGRLAFSMGDLSQRLAHLDQRLTAGFAQVDQRFA